MSKFESIYELYIKKHAEWNDNPQLSEHLAALPILVAADFLSLSVHKDLENVNKKKISYGGE